MKRTIGTRHRQPPWGASSVGPCSGTTQAPLPRLGLLLQGSYRSRQTQFRKEEKEQKRGHSLCVPVLSLAVYHLRVYVLHSATRRASRARGYAVDVTVSHAHELLLLLERLDFG